MTNSQFNNRQEYERGAHNTTPENQKCAWTPALPGQAVDILPCLVKVQELRQPKDQEPQRSALGENQLKKLT